MHSITASSTTGPQAPMACAASSAGQYRMMLRSCSDSLIAADAELPAHLRDYSRSASEPILPCRHSGWGPLLASSRSAAATHEASHTPRASRCVTTKRHACAKPLIAKSPNGPAFSRAGSWSRTPSSFTRAPSTAVRSFAITRAASCTRTASITKAVQTMEMEPAQVPSSFSMITRTQSSEMQAAFFHLTVASQPSIAV